MGNLSFLAEMFAEEDRIKTPVEKDLDLEKDFVHFAIKELWNEIKSNPATHDMSVAQRLAIMFSTISQMPLLNAKITKDSLSLLCGWIGGSVFILT